MARKKISDKPRRTILIVTATEAEALYFSQMRKDCRFSNLTVQWEQEFKDLEHLITLASRYRNSGNYSVVWVMFGLADMGLSPSDVKAQLAFAKQKKVGLAWTNPSLPLWFLLHTQTPRGFVGETKLIESALAKALPGYTADASYLLTDGMYLHLKLFPSKAKAALNANSYNRLVEEKLGLSAITLVPLLNDITDICGLADLTHNQKQLGMNKG
ncbi:RloB family protein [Sphaerochaeta sp. PS]|uniref:RloB family protein n=1 Tax=Sphaerochaeta sp. PS TaxID=3076336 RepID=UPI0028A50C12|nr:RloB domain-containing protein [Sphaerochaeta sp. PS]MDT4762384.1 RloB domain-containing protein [Sphaerochaeta sp. PS]